jgi:hypothetical protein
MKRNEKHLFYCAALLGLVSLLVLTGCGVHIEYDPVKQTFIYDRTLMQPENVSAKATLPDGTKIEIDIGENATQKALVQSAVAAGAAAALGVSP